MNEREKLSAIWQERAEKVGELIAGRPKTLEEYRYAVGYIAALTFVIETFGTQGAGDDTFARFEKRG